VRNALPHSPSLESGVTASDVHVWWTWLDFYDDHIVDDLAELLAAGERARASRFKFARDRRQFVVSHAMLRLILACQLSTKPENIKFERETYGKPRLARQPDAACVEFNLSHSRNMAVVAVADRPVGVDVERMDPEINADHVAIVAFSEAERVSLLTLAPEWRLWGFFSCWTRKEAYLKARGDGLLVPLSTFDVSLAPTAPVALLANRLDPDDVERWWLAAFQPAEGFVGAVAVQGAPCRLVVRRWDLAAGFNR
jgi:4'-phosphopantetheinyl transferase